MEKTSYLDDPDDVLTADEARQLIRPPSEAVWERWHRLRIIPYYVMEGTRQRRYSKCQLLDWVRAGAKAVAK